MKKVFFLLCLTLGSSMFALLPPLAQSTREIQAVLSDPRMQELLGSAELIKDVIRSDNGYIVLTQNYLMSVEVQYVKGETNRVGPAQFHLKFNQPIDRRTSSTCSGW